MSLVTLETTDPSRLHDVVAGFAANIDVLLLDSPVAFGPKGAVLPVILADRIIIVLQSTVSSLSDGLKAQEHAHSRGIDTTGVAFNHARSDENVETVIEQASRYFEGQTLASALENDAIRTVRRKRKPLLIHTPDDPAIDAFYEAVARLDVCEDDDREVVERFKSAVVPERM